LAYGVIYYELLTGVHGLGAETAEGFGVIGGGEDLDRNQAIDGRIEGTVNLPEAAAADLAPDLVLADEFASGGHGAFADLTAI
jgi:hypothetical protein